MIDLSKVWEVREKKESDVNECYKAKIKNLDRATYVELKLVGYSDYQICKKFGLKLDQLSDIRGIWEFRGLKTQDWMDKLERAKAQEKRMSINKTG